MLKQLRTKFVAVIALVSALMLIILLSTIYQFTAANLEAENIRMMQSVNDSVGPGAFRPNALRPNDRLHYFILALTPRGELLIVDNTSFDLSDSELISELYATAANSIKDNGVLQEYSLRFCAVPYPGGTAYVFSDISDELATLASLRRTCIIIGLAALLVILVLSNLLAKWMVAPVEKSWQQQRDFVSDASHELKTPLTVIMTNTEMLSSPDYSPAEKEQFTENIAHMTHRMRTLVEGMLDLARVDKGVVQTAFTQFDFSRAVEDCILPFEPVFFESDRMLETQLSPDIRLSGSESHLRQVVDILLDNALKYSDEASTVYVTLQKSNNRALLCVDSAGAPIDKEDLTNIFLRFYRVDKARTGGSYGLGLSIAQGIITEHKGKIWAESSDGRNKFFVSLPL